MAIQPSGIDERKKESNDKGLARAKRIDVSKEELRQLVRHKRAIALVGYAPPIKFLRPPLVEACPEQLSRAANKGTPYVIDFQTAEPPYESAGTKKPRGSRGNPNHPAELSQLQNSLANEVDEDRTHRRSQDPSADDQSLEV
jgi:hypothetical protein